MAFKNRKPGVVVDSAKVRLDGMRQIDKDLGATVNYGSVANSLTQNDVDTQIVAIEKQISEYNQLLEKATATLNNINTDEVKLDEMYMRILKGAVAQFGSNSNEVEVLGGTRFSERKPTVRKKKTT